MRYLVTGGAGFIGSHLVDRLLSRGDHVIVVDDFSTGNLANLPMDHPELEIYRKAIHQIDKTNIDHIDVVYHLAALTRPQQSVYYPVKFDHVNVNGTVKMLDWAWRHGVKKFIFASSAAVYGEQGEYPTHEFAIPNPMTPYGLQKYIG